jgi:hypothetical protein
VVPPTSGIFRAVFAGDSTRPRVESTAVRVDVIPRLSMTLDRSTMRLGQKVAIRGTVDPSQLVQCVIERRSGNRWVTERSLRANVVNGRFGLRVRLRRVATYRITVISGPATRRRTMHVR